MTHLMWLALGGLFGGAAVGLPLLHLVQYWRTKAQNLRAAHEVSFHFPNGPGYGI